MAAMETEYAEEEVVENPTLKAAYNKPLLHHNQPLRWDYEVHLLGEKMCDKVIHLCEICELPILVYGRMLPCKHIFCFECARKCEKTCKRCDGKVLKLEKSALGTVYVCTHGAPKHCTDGCRRTYLSQRDLQSHIAHRHTPKASSDSKHTQATSAVAAAAPSSQPQLPLTQQQAAQQRASLMGSGGHGSALHSHAHTAPPAHVASVTKLQPSPQGGPGLHPHSMTGAQQVIPGLGDLHPLVNPGLAPSSPNLGSAPSSAMVPTRGMHSGVGFSPSTHSGSDQSIYRPLDMVPLGQHQPQLQQHQQAQPPPQQVAGLGHSKSPLQTFLQSGQMPMSSGMMQQLNSQQLAASRSPQMNPPAMTHQHAGLSSQSHLHGGLSTQKNLEVYSKEKPMPSGPPMSQPRSNNLITVPIQDEGQYRPPPFVPSSQSHSGMFDSPVSQANSGVFGSPASQGNNPPFGNPALQSSNLSFGNPASQSNNPAFGTPAQQVSNPPFGTQASQSSSIPFANPAAQQNNSPFGGSTSQQSNSPFPNPSPQQRETQGFSQNRTNMASPSQMFPQNPISSASFSAPNSFNQAQTLTNSSQGVAFNSATASGLRPSNQGTVMGPMITNANGGVVGGMRQNNPGLMLNTRPGMGNNLPFIADVMQAMNMARAQGRPGLIPTPAGQNSPRFHGNQWPAQRGIQPRMTQGQQRPRGESQFKPNYYS